MSELTSARQMGPHDRAMLQARIHTSANTRSGASAAVNCCWREQQGLKKRQKGRRELCPLREAEATQRAFLQTGAGEQS